MLKAPGTVGLKHLPFLRMRRKAVLIICAYAVVLAGCIWLYYSYPSYRKEEEFWIPQLFLLIMISVTTLYVFYTANLVDETRRLQERPYLQLAFHESAHLPQLKMTQLYESAQELMRGIVKVVGGEEVKPQTGSLVIKVRNVGRLTARGMSINVVMTVADRPFSQKQEFGDDIRPEQAVDIAVAPASLPWLKIEVQDMSYTDGMRKYSDFTGTAKYRRTVGQED